MNYIDAHVHVWTPDTAHYPLAAGFKKDDMKPPSFTPQELFKHSKPAGVARVNLIQMSFYGFSNPFPKCNSQPCPPAIQPAVVKLP
jgi:predicted TIM-barrel fold metal-dependent hydrolase